MLRKQEEPGAVEKWTRMHFQLSRCGKETETSFIQSGNNGHRTHEHSARSEIKQQRHTRGNSNGEYSVDPSFPLVGTRTAWRLHNRQKFKANL